MRDDGIGGKYESMVKSYGRIQDYSAVENIERNNNETEKEDYDSRYRMKTLPCSIRKQPQGRRNWNTCVRCRNACGKVQREAKRWWRIPPGCKPLSEEERLARSEQRRKEALAELDKAQAEARKKGKKRLQDVDSTDAESLAPTGSVAIGGKVEINEQAVNELAENAESEQVVKKGEDFFGLL